MMAAPNAARSMNLDPRFALLALLVLPALAACADDLVHRDGFDSPICGNGVIEAGEACDDGGRVSADGCDALCALEPDCASDPFHCMTECEGLMPPPGFVRNAGVDTWEQLSGSATFPAMNPALAVVPHGADVVFLGATRRFGYSGYASIRFTVPHDFTGDVQLDWATSQIPGAPGQLVPSTAVVLDISQCSGDFRVAIENPYFATELPGCNSVYIAPDGTAAARSSLRLTTNGPSTNSVCAVRPGRTYILNYSNANPLPSDGGITFGEWTCPDNGETCGVQLRATIVPGPAL